MNHAKVHARQQLCAAWTKTVEALACDPCAGAGAAGFTGACVLTQEQQALQGHAFPGRGLQGWTPSMASVHTCVAGVNSGAGCGVV